MAKVADLIYRIAGDSSSFVKALAKADKELANFNRNASRVAKGTALMGAALGAVGGYLGAMTKKALDDADALGKLSYRTGVAVEDLSRLEYALSLSDSSLEDFGVGAKNLNKILADTEAGNEKAAKALANLGIAALDASGKARPLNDVFLDVADRFKAMPDGATKATAAVNIFGKAGTKLIPALNNGAAGLREMGKEAEQLGLVLSTDTTDAAQLVNDNLTRMQKAGEGLGRQILVTLAPAMSILTSEMVENAKQTDTLRSRQEAATTGMRLMLVAVRSVGFAFEGLGMLIGQFAAGMVIQIQSTIDVLYQMGRVAAMAITSPIEFAGAAGDALVRDAARKISEIETIREAALVTMARDRAALAESYTEDLDRIWNANGNQTVEPPKIDQAKTEATGRRFGAGVRKGAKSEMDKIAEDMRRTAERIFNDTRTAAERAKAEFAELDALVAGGFIDTDTANRRARQIEADRDKDAIERMKEIGEQAQAVRESVMTSAEMLERRALELESLFSGGDIDRNTFTLAMRALYEELDATTIKARELQEQGLSLAESLTTPAEQATAKFAELSLLLDAGAINAETYRRALASLGGDEFIASSEKTALELERINELLRLGVIDAEQYESALSRLFPEAQKSLTETEQFGVDTAKSLQRSFAQFLFDPFSVGLDGMVKGFAQSLARMVAELMAKKAVLALLGAFGASPELIAATGFAEGGFVTGPGTGTSDSIPARLSNGEYVMPADTVRHYGRDFMDAIRGMRTTREAPVARFAEGGYVDGQGGGGGGGVRVVNVVDSSMMQDYLTSSAGEQVVMNVIRRNRRQVSQVMA
jgi:hypothetical protein